MWISAEVIAWVIKKQKAWVDSDRMIDWSAVKEKAIKYISVVSINCVAHYILQEPYLSRHPRYRRLPK
jgi:hypothetical protein